MNQGNNPSLRVTIDVYFKPKGSNKNYRELFTVIFWGDDGHEFADKVQLGYVCRITGTMRQVSWQDKVSKAHVRAFQIHGTGFEVIDNMGGEMPVVTRPDPNEDVPF